MEPNGSLLCSQDAPLVHVPSQVNSFHTFLPYFPKIRYNIFLPSTPRSSEWSLPLSFSDHFSSFPCLLHTPPPHFILLDVITLIKFGKDYKLRSSSLCGLLQSPSTSFHLGSNVLLTTLFWNTFVLSVVWETKFLTRAEQHVQLYFFIYFDLKVFTEEMRR
jgi:hypothetical protein